jgi:hypothetical protein
MAAADLDHNGKLETILFNNFFNITGAHSEVHVFQPDGSERPGWPVAVNDSQFAQAYFAVGDFKRDGHEEIVFTHETSLYLFNSDGSLFSNAWPLTTGILGYGAAVIGDIDGDGLPEIVITRNDFSGFYDAKLLAIRSDGTTARTWQLTGRNGYDQYAYPLPIIGDFDQNGTTDIAVAYEVTGPGNLIPGVVTIVTTGAPFNAANNDWPMSLQNARDTAILVRTSATTLGLTLSTGANPSVFGVPLTFTGGVTPNAATGNVVFLDNGKAISPPVAVVGGSATFTTSSLGVGGHSITAHYAGDGSHDASTSGAVSQNVTPATLTITANGASRPFGASNPAFSGTVSGGVNGDTFTETFSTTATVTSGVGGYAIVPSVTGSDLANYTVSPVNGTLTVTPAALTITADNASRPFGASNPVFSGTVGGGVNGDTFTESFSTSATATSVVGGYAIVPSVTGSDIANYTVSPVNGTLTVTPAALTITADNASRPFGASNPTFSGTVSGGVNGDTFTESFSTSATATSAVGGYAIVPNVTGSDLANYTVNPVNGTLTVTPAALTITANNASRPFGATNPAFSGAVNGAVNGDSFTESFSTTATSASPVGSYPIVPSVTGADIANYTVTPVNGTLTVNQAGSVTTLLTSNAAANAGTPVTFTATATSATTGTPTGQIQFLDGATPLGSGTLNPQGVAAFTSSSLPGGTHNVTAVYGGDSDFTGSTSPAVIENIMDFTEAASPSSASIKAGGSATFTLTVTPLGGFNGTVSWSCSQLPAEAQCTFAPQSVTPNGAAATTTLTITTTAPSAARAPSPMRRNTFPLYASLAGAMGMIWLAASGRKRGSVKRSLLMVLLTLCVLAILVSCGGGGGSMGSPGNPGTPLGTSTIVVNASSGGGAHTASVSLTVTN